VVIRADQCGSLSDHHLRQLPYLFLFRLRTLQTIHHISSGEL